MSVGGRASQLRLSQSIRHRSWVGAILVVGKLLYIACCTDAVYEQLCVYSCVCCVAGRESCLIHRHHSLIKRHGNLLL